MSRAAVVACLAALLCAQAREMFAEDVQPEGPEVTLKGQVLCHRACITKPWDQASQGPEHYPVLYAYDGTPEVRAALDKIMADHYPDKDFEADAALKLMKAFDEKLRYYVAPGPVTAKMHKEVEWGAQNLAVTGVVFEKNGEKWIYAKSFKWGSFKVPGKMLAPDKPFKMPAEKPLEIKVDEKLSMKCLLLPAGRFIQGSPFFQPRWQDEYPHEVILTKPFYMSETPVTQEMFEAVIGKNPSKNKGPRFPVEYARFSDIQKFCEVLSEKNGRTIRLPTDAEFEYAARVGTSSPCFNEKYRDQVSRAATKEGDPQPVKTKKPNAWGLYDMICGGWHTNSDYKTDNFREKQVDPKGPPRNWRGVPGIQKGDGGCMRKSRGGQHGGQLRPSMHGANGENGGSWEGTTIFRIVVEATPEEIAAMAKRKP